MQFKTLYIRKKDRDTSSIMYLIPSCGR